MAPVHLATRGKSLNQLEKRGGFVVLIAIATQTREGRTREPTDGELIAAKVLFNKAFRKTTSTKPWGDRVYLTSGIRDWHSQFSLAAQQQKQQSINSSRRTFPTRMYRH